MTPAPVLNSAHYLWCQRFDSAHAWVVCTPRHSTLTLETCQIQTFVGSEVPPPPSNHGWGVQNPWDHLYSRTKWRQHNWPPDTGVIMFGDPLIHWPPRKLGNGVKMYNAFCVEIWPAPHCWRTHSCGYSMSCWCNISLKPPKITGSVTLQKAQGQNLEGYNCAES